MSVVGRGCLCKFRGMGVVVLVVGGGGAGAGAGREEGGEDSLDSFLSLV